MGAGDDSEAGIQADRDHGRVMGQIYGSYTNEGPSAQARSRFVRNGQAGRIPDQTIVAEGVEALTARNRHRNSRQTMSAASNRSVEGHGRQR